MPSVRKSDLDRLRRRLQDAVKREPALQMLLDKLPDDYDPAQAPTQLSADGAEEDEPEEEE